MSKKKRKKKKGILNFLFRIKNKKYRKKNKIKNNKKTKLRSIKNKKFVCRSSNPEAENIRAIIGSPDIKRKINGEVDIVRTKKQMQDNLLFHLSMDTAGTTGEEKRKILAEYAKMLKFISDNNNVNNYIRDYK